MLFENDGGGNRSGELKIPPRPEMSKDFSTRILPAKDEDLARAPTPTFKLEEPAEIEPIPEALPEHKTSKPTQAAATAPVKPAEQKTQQSKGPRAWVLQVASFSRRKNADQLVKRLRAKKFPAYQEQATVNRKPVFRVRIGPEADRKLVEKMLKRVARDFKLKGQVVRYP
jgi:DedD protein